MASAKEPFAQSLLQLAHPDDPEEASRIYKEKVAHRPLDFRHTLPSSAGPPKDARARRRDERLKKKLAKSKSKPSNKPQPLSAREKRALGVYDIPKEAQKYAIYEPLNKLWLGYIQEILKGSFGANGTAGQAAAAKICAADFHGCELEVVRNRCPSRVGIKGIVIKDTKMTFVIITKKNQVKHVPKEYSVFKFVIPWPESTPTDQPAEPIVLELHGSNFMFRAAERMNKKFKAKAMDQL
ncbi:hypothetical protein H072_2621 [Dactylellina haptotyla CBS 200.50]|uniref:Ribonuclease P protein subunit n=1 Tax=Dactylellina haptotyla (strain CBS 200.50) TaxID=1284197 RepID=S8C6T3_DACHA|nr:hypothetical protein H072_2621 [Dactylellina haptotyla CBS 200.50]